jgi:hypothetical protein
MEQLINSYKELFQEPKSLPAKMEVEHGIQLLSESFPSIGLYRQYILEFDELKKKFHFLLENGVINLSA